MSGEDELFEFLDDLEARSGALYDAERAPELADRARSEYARVVLASRLMASLDTEVAVHVAGVGSVAGVLDRVGSGWCRVAATTGAWVVRTDAVLAVERASARAVPDVAWPATARLGLGSPLRRLADAGERCVLHRVDGGRHDGVLVRVGADFVEVAEGEPPRVTLVALAGLAALRSSRVD